MSAALRVLVTGGAGYVGSHACKALMQAGHVPITFDNLSTGLREAVRFGPFEEGDILDRGRLDEVFACHRPDAVMHFAAASLVGESMADPGTYWRSNLVGSLNVIEAALAAGCKRFVFSSTCAVYGQADGRNLDETSRREPVTTYGAAKRAVEDMLANFALSHGLNPVMFRYFNVAGADPDAEIGERRDHATHIVPVVLSAAAGERPHLVINGTDYDTPDGTCVRDYVHVADVAEAHLAGLDWLMRNDGPRAFNLGTGRGFSVREVIETAMRVTGRQIEVRIGPRRPGDVARLVSGSGRAERELGWRARRSSLERMIADAWRWHQAEGGEA